MVDYLKICQQFRSTYIASRNKYIMNKDCIKGEEDE